MAKLTQAMVIEAAKAFGNKGFTMDELRDKLGRPGGTVEYHLNKAMQSGCSNICKVPDPSRGKNRVRYFFKPVTDGATDPVPKKNPEGYSDPTAERAIRMAEAEDLKSNFKIGGVYQRTSDNSPFLIMHLGDECANGYYLSSSTAAVNSKNIICWKDGVAVRSINIESIQSLKLSKLKTYPVFKNAGLTMDIYRNEILPKFPFKKDVVKEVVEKEVVKTVVDEEAVAARNQEFLCNFVKSACTLMPRIDPATATIDSIFKEIERLDESDRRAYAFMADLRNLYKMPDADYRKLLTAILEDHELATKKLEPIKVDYSLDLALAKQKAELFKYCFDRITAGFGDEIETVVD